MKKNHVIPVLITLIIFISRVSTEAEELKVGNQPKRYIEPIFETIDVQKDIVFGEVTNYEGMSEQLLLDVYAPIGDTQIDRPVILWIHGGGFRKGNDKSQGYIIRMATEFAKRGYVCVSINYRVRDNPREDKTGTMKHAMEDAMSGLDWIRNNNNKLKIDKNKIIVGGGSAGGMLAVNLCYKDDKGPEKWDKSGVIGLVNLWGTPDESWMMSQIDKKDPPTIIVHGTADELVPYLNSEQLVRELERKKVKHELITISGAGHTPTSHMDEFTKDIAIFLYGLMYQK